jgi:hypothetical protein
VYQKNERALLGELQNRRGEFFLFPPYNFYLTTAPTPFSFSLEKVKGSVNFRELYLFEYD